MKQESKEMMSEVVWQHHFHFKIFKELQGHITNAVIILNSKH